jgi:microcin C transport system permease protein
MAAYILRRILLMIPTILGIMFISFLVVQFAPGGPVERVIAQLQGTDVSATARISGGTGDFAGQAEQYGRRGGDTASAPNTAALQGCHRNS